MKTKYEDLKCEFCDGAGEISRDKDGAAVEYACSYCDGTGIDKEQLKNVFMEQYSGNPCGSCGCSKDAHHENGFCPIFHAGEFYGWLETKFTLSYEN